MDEEELTKLMQKTRKDFPILKQKVNSKKLVYVDNAATTQKPLEVINSITEFYTNYNSNVHRGIHTLSEKATDEFEASREKVANFINAKKDEIVFTSGTTHSINQIAFGLEDYLKKGDEIVLSEMEHHADIVPWQEIAKKVGAKINFIPVTKDYEIDLFKAKKLINKKTKVVSITHISNVLGTINPIKQINNLAKSVGALFIIDGAQSVPHMKIDVKKLDCDFLVFSAHKMCGPTGVGVLYGKMSALELLKPLMYGGSMIYEVELEKSTFTKIPERFEAGTPNIAGIIAFGKTIDYLNKIGMKNIEEYEKVLVKYFMKKIKELKDVKLFGPSKISNRASVFSINIDGVHSHDVSTILDKFGIAIRGGHHCAMPLAKVMGVSSTSRISLYFYNSKSEIDYIINSLKKVKSEFNKGEFLIN